MGHTFVNNLKTVLLLGLLTGLLVGVGAMLGSGYILPFLVISLLMNVGAWFFSDKIAIAAMRGREVDAQTGGDLYRLVDELRQNAGLPMPRVYICPHEAPNAFATGRSPKKAAVAFTQGALNLLSREELRGVIAHELAHIKNRDMLLQTFTATLAGAISFLGDMAMWGMMFAGGRDDDEGNPFAALVMAIVAPIAAMLIQFAISRQREFKADAVGAEICGKPLALAGALRKLEMAARQIPMNVAPAVAPLAQVNPLAAHGGGFARLFSTHPPTQERVARLERLAAAMNAGARL